MIEPQKWASTLGSLSDTVTLPDEDLQFASFKKLFPALTQVPLSEGGVAPQRTDFNTLFKLLGDNIFYLQQGGVFSYSDTADYERGAFVKYNNELYLCIQDNNSSNIHAPTDAEYWLRVALNNDLANYLPLVGGNITGNLTVQNKNVVRSVNGVNADTSGNADVISGDNSYVRFAEGTQIVYQGYDQTAHPTSIQFVKPFRNIPLCYPIILHKGEMAILTATIKTVSTTEVSIYAYYNGKPIYNGLTMGFIAFGRWK